MTRLFLSSKTIELLEHLFPQSHSLTPEAISFTNLLGDDACFTINKKNNLFTVTLHNKTINLTTTLYYSASIQLAISYVHFLKTKAVSPLYLAVPATTQTSLSKPRRFTQSGLCSPAGNFNTIVWFTNNNHRVVACFPQTFYNDFRVDNHMVEYMNYVEELLNRQVESGILEP